MHLQMQNVSEQRALIFLYVLPVQEKIPGSHLEIWKTQGISCNFSDDNLFLKLVDIGPKTKLENLAKHLKVIFYFLSGKILINKDHI